MKIQKVHASPQDILNNPLLNKGTAFTEEERSELGLHGLLPYQSFTLEQQVKKRYENFSELTSKMAQYQYLSTLQNRNEVLFFRLVQEHVDEMLPLIYTPTVGDVSMHYSMLYTQQRGVYFPYPLMDQFDTIVKNIPQEEVQVIVATDGERVLGLGDLGVGGMAISIGKLALYTLFGGIDPAKVLPIHLDCGTNNPELFNDPMYIGWRHERVRGEEYDRFIAAFVKAIQKRFPKVLLQWEDFGRPNAQNLLEHYRDKITSFNDDIQGTASVVLAALLAAVKHKKSHLKDQKIVVVGAGSAGIGICNQLLSAMMQEGISREEALKRFYVVDRKGLIHTESANIDAFQKPFAQEFSSLAHWKTTNPQLIPLLDVVKNAHPTVLIGVCTQKGIFTEDIVTSMAHFTPRPIIMPLSNPKSCSEADPADLIKWTKGEAIVASGSPYEPVLFNGRSYPITQCNNVYIFPGVGLGVIACKAKKVTDEMFTRAAEILSNHAPILHDPQKPLFPSFKELKAISKKIAIGVVEIAQKQHLSPKTSHEEIEKMVSSCIWDAEYPVLKR